MNIGQTLMEKTIIGLLLRARPFFYHPYQSILSDLDFEIEFIQTDIKYGKFTCGYILAKRIST